MKTLKLNLKHFIDAKELSREDLKNILGGVGDEDDGCIKEGKACNVRDDKCCKGFECDSRESKVDPLCWPKSTEEGTIG